VESTSGPDIASCLSRKRYSCENYSSEPKKVRLRMPQELAANTVSELSYALVLLEEIAQGYNNEDYRLRAIACLQTSRFPAARDLLFDILAKRDTPINLVIRLRELCMTI
jgi:hypothetical protein